MTRQACDGASRDQCKAGIFLFCGEEGGARLRVVDFTAGFFQALQALLKICDGFRKIALIPFESEKPRKIPQ